MITRSPKAVKSIRRKKCCISVISSYDRTL